MGWWGEGEEIRKEERRDRQRRAIEDNNQSQNTAAVFTVSLTNEMRWKS